jgi:hypothetical protein
MVVIRVDSGGGEKSVGGFGGLLEWPGWKFDGISGSFMEFSDGWCQEKPGDLNSQFGLSGDRSSIIFLQVIID